MRERVYGPTLTGLLLSRAAEEGIPVFFYGSSQSVLDDLVSRCTERWPGLVVAGAEPSQFRQGTASDCDEIASRITASGARIAFIGLGCPRQEVMAYMLRSRVAMPVLAVGAAFDYHAGHLSEPPAWQQRAGLQWLYRLVQEPRRLWRRYLLLNPQFVTLVALQRLGLWRPSDAGVPPAEDTPIDI
jgi:exopolysaccharide biosynthesis WecB/TagA/CpsF family protein